MALRLKASQLCWGSAGCTPSMIHMGVLGPGSADSLVGFSVFSGGVLLLPDAQHCMAEYVNKYSMVCDVSAFACYVG